RPAGPVPKSESPPRVRPWCAPLPRGSDGPGGEPGRARHAGGPVPAVPADRSGGTPTRPGWSWIRVVSHHAPGGCAMSQAIEVVDLVKLYPGGTTAVDGLSFQVRRGEIFGLLGPNGSGKTTTVRILVTLLSKTSGVVRVAGLDVDRQPKEVRKMVGYAGQFIGLDDDLTARENLIL